MLPDSNAQYSIALPTDPTLSNWQTENFPLKQPAGFVIHFRSIFLKSLLLIMALAPVSLPSPAAAPVLPLATAGGLWEGVAPGRCTALGTRVTCVLALPRLQHPDKDWDCPAMTYHLLQNYAHYEIVCIHIKRENKSVIQVIFNHSDYLTHVNWNNCWFKCYILLVYTVFLQIKVNHSSKQGTEPTIALKAQSQP